MSMTEEAYHLSLKEMALFIKELEHFMEPFKTHSTRFTNLLEKLNEKCFKVSSTGIQTTLQTVAMFPDLRDSLMETMDGFADMAEIQGDLLETAGDLSKDFAVFILAYTSLLRKMIESRS